LPTNAARYAGEGEVVLSVRRVQAGRLEFRVADTGPGIPEDERERIFDKFHQVRRGDTTAAEKRGTGLGLAICKQIVERYHGDIRAEAREPRGTVFVVELPVPCGTSGPQAGPEDDRQTSQPALS
jgi:signal transduction histidine kinase